MKLQHKISVAVDRARQYRLEPIGILVTVLGHNKLLQEFEEHAKNNFVVTKDPDIKELVRSPDVNAMRLGIQFLRVEGLPVFVGEREGLLISMERP